MAKILSDLNVEGSVLFLGSGFSRDATNIAGTHLPVGDELRNHLADILGVEHGLFDLRTLADEIVGRSTVSLYQTLYELYTVQRLAPYQSRILRLPWRRIYTTNYDDAVELAHHEARIDGPSYSYDEPKPPRLANGTIIHLHGVIRKATEENVLQQLVLNESSYIRQHFDKSPWYGDFVRDLTFCDACFFVGYSLSDYHIAALLMQNPKTSEKTYFITRPNPPEIFLNRVAPYGSVVSIGLERFAAACEAAPQRPAVTDMHHLKAFKYLDPFVDRRTVAPPTALEIRNLVAYGTFNYPRCITSLPRAEYVVPRQRQVDDGIAALDEARCLLIHSRIGNGKTIFLYILGHALSQRGFKCFLVRPDPIISTQDLAVLKSLERPVLIFDSYNAAVEVIPQLGELPQATRFIVSVRTGVQEVRLHEIQERLPAPLARLSLNGLRSEDVDDFRALLDRAGVKADDMEGVLAKSRDYRDVVVSLYDNSDIRDKIRLELVPLLADARFRSVFVASNLLKWMAQEVDAAFIRSVTGCDAYAELAKYREVSGDLYELDDEQVTVRSPLLAQHLIRHHVSADDIVDSIFTIVIESVKRRRERRFRTILGMMMQVSRLSEALHRFPDRIQLLVRLFERLRRDI